MEEKPEGIPFEERICPYLNSPCIKERCLRYQPAQVVELKVGVPIPKEVYMCLDQIMLGQFQGITNLLAASVQGKMGGGIQFPYKKFGG